MKEGHLGSPPPHDHYFEHIVFLHVGCLVVKSYNFGGNYKYINIEMCTI